MKNYKIAVAGTGYVGLSLGVLLSQHHQVVAVDIVQAKVDMINNKKSPIQDDYIEKYLAEKELNLTATLDAKAAYSDADFVVIAAPTNYDSKTQHFDTSAVEAVIKLVMEYVDDLKKQAEMIRAEQIKLYESYADGILTRNEYLEKKKGLGEKLADLQEKIRIEEEEQETADELDEEIRSLTKQASQKTYIGGLTKECVDAFVSMVYLYDDQTMKVEFNCEDVIRRALEKYGA